MSFRTYTGALDKTADLIFSVYAVHVVSVAQILVIWQGVIYQKTWIFSNKDMNKNIVIIF
jgi:hypothetical protein